MFGMQTLDLIIGLVTIYLAFGIATTACVEAVSSVFKLRATNLKHALEEMLSGSLGSSKELVDDVYDSPLIQTLSKGSKGKPSYLPKSIVSQVVESLVITRNAAGSLVEGIEKMPDNKKDGSPNRVKDLLKQFQARADREAKEFNEVFEEHFDAVMERSTGWYKRRIQWVTLFVSALLVVGANVDTIEIARTLSTNADVRQALVEVAANRVRQEEGELAKVKPNEQATDESATLQSAQAVEGVMMASNDALKRTNEAVSLVGGAGIGLGWIVLPNDSASWLGKIFGLTVSIFAVSLGAPFWFNVLQKVVQLRATGVQQAIGKKPPAQ